MNLDSIDDFLFIMIRNEAISHLRQVKHEKERYAKLPQDESEDPEILNILIEEESNQILVNGIINFPLRQPSSCVSFSPGMIIKR